MLLLLLCWHELPFNSESIQRLSAAAQEKHHVLEHSVMLDWWKRSFTVALTLYIDPCWATPERPVKLVTRVLKRRDTSWKRERRGGKEKPQPERERARSWSSAHTYQAFRTDTKQSVKTKSSQNKKKMPSNIGTKPQKQTKKIRILFDF